MVGLWNRSAGRYGLPHHEPGVYGADLRDPVSVMAQTSGHNKDSYPKWSIIQYEFAATNKRPAVKLTWYDGGKRPPLELLGGAEISGSGSLVVGDKGSLYSPDDYGSSSTLIGNVEVPDVTIQESPGHFQEFVEAIKGGRPSVSNFADYSGPLTEMVLLGNLAVWAADSGAAQRSSGTPSCWRPRTCPIWNG